jgi:hypothetical protein
MNKQNTIIDSNNNNNSDNNISVFKIATETYGNAAGSLAALFFIILMLSTLIAQLSKVGILIPNLLNHSLNKEMAILLFALFMSLITFINGINVAEKINNILTLIMMISFSSIVALALDPSSGFDIHRLFNRSNFSSLLPFNAKSSVSWAIPYFLQLLVYTETIPLVVSRAYGLIGYLRIQIRSHAIIESKPDSKSYDLRIANSFKEFEEYCDGFDFDTSDTLSHCHIPYPVILFKAISTWKANNGGTMPTNKAAKDSFEALLKSLSIDINKETNFEEAVKHKSMAFTVSSLPGPVQELMEETSQKPLTKDDSEFDILLKSLKIFIEKNNGNAPLNGQVPDMTATSASFVQIQKIYHDYLY